MKTFSTLLTGGGGFDTGAQAAGYKPLWGVEIDPDIARYAELNTPGLTVVRSDIATVGYAGLERPYHLHASPQCANASVANTNAGETDEDLSQARAICGALEVLEPVSFSLENVWRYRGFESFRTIRDRLTELNYAIDWWHLNAADYGVPQTRKRLVLLASRERQPRKPTPTHSENGGAGMFGGLYPRWVSWYEAIEDLIPTLPDSEFAAWQLERLPPEMASMLAGVSGYGGRAVRAMVEEPAFTITANRNQTGIGAFLADGQNRSSGTVRNGSMPAFAITDQSKGVSRAFVIGSQYGQPNTVENRRPQIRTGDEPYFTITASGGQHSGQRAFVGPRVVGMTPRALARIQSVPDSYALPGSNPLSCKIIGNMVPPLLAQRVVESLQ